MKALRLCLCWWVCRAWRFEHWIGATSGSCIFENQVLVSQIFLHRQSHTGLCLPDHGHVVLYSCWKLTWMTAATGHMGHSVYSRFWDWQVSRLPTLITSSGDVRLHWKHVTFWWRVLLLRKGKDHAVRMLHDPTSFGEIPWQRHCMNSRSAL